ncbi:DNA-dependent protein kinase catalytic subunit [Echinococcus granulosus]|uniref:DNA-dependent protein kinase catalytic subunit n=1 Tax=Echinococcus granulosus TaxID=6210 RepID=W6UBY0_ECHGR|nr:DNA-dependent protein kinase catalytic subunit [Echinococcus granulosus]EUB58898.1 DNA-dependent protein kinase catalytic subunit [Echinococcus granulosus]
MAMNPNMMVRCLATVVTPPDVKKFYNYSLQILLADLDKIGQYRPIKSACKLLRSCAKRLNICDWDRIRLALSYLQTLVNHKNSALAKAARGAYIALLMCYRNFALTESTPDGSVSSVPGNVTNYLINPPPSDVITSNQLPFRLKCLSILMPVYEKCPTTQDSAQILSYTVKEIVHLVSEISGTPIPPKAYCLPDLIESTVNVLTIRPSAQLIEALWRSLKLAIIACFESYPRLSQNVTESIAHCIFNAFEILANEKHLVSVLNETFYHAVLQTCSHSPFDLEDSESGGESEVEGEVVEEDLDSVSQPSGSFQTKIAIPRPSYREYLPLWRNLLGFPMGLVKKERYARSNVKSTPLIFRLLLTSSLAILKRLDFSYAECNTDTGEVESQVVVKNPQDVLLLSNMAAFLEQVLPDCLVATHDAIVPSFLQTCLELVEKYPLLSGLYRLLKLAVLLAKQSNFFKECSTSPTLTHLRSFAISLLEAFPPTGALSADDLSTARCSCLLSLPLSVFTLHPEGRLFSQFAYIIASICQLAGSQGHCEHLATAAASAVESWLDEIKSKSSTYPMAFGSLVPALAGLLEIHHDKPIASKAPPPLIGQRSRRSDHRVGIRPTLRAIAGRPNRLNFDSPLSKAQMKIIEIIGQNAQHWELLNLVETPNEDGTIFGNILPSEKGVFNDLTLCLPFPDLRPYIRLSDVRLFARLLRILLWRPKSTTKSTNQINTSVSRQARVSAAEYLHEYIVFGLIKQREIAPDPSDPIGESDSAYWSLLFHVTFILGADTDQLICRLFRCLAFQLVHWYAGYRMAGLCEAKLLQKVILRILCLAPPEDDICGFIDSRWPLSELVQTRRTKLASACLQDFFKWMSSETTGNKRRPASIGDQTFEDLLRLNLKGLCQDGAAAQVFTNTIANLLSARPEMAFQHVYLLIDAFKRSLLSAPGQGPVAAALKRAVGLLTELMKKSPEGLIYDDCVTPEKQPRLTRTVKTNPMAESLKPTSWETASVPSCLKSLLLACRDPLNGKLFQELVEQIVSSSSLRLIRKVLPDTASLISTFEWKLDSSSGFTCCLNNYAWLLSANLITNTAFFEAIQLPESRIIAFLKRYCGAEENMAPDESTAVIKFLLAILHSKPRVDLSSVFSENHTVWNFLGRSLLKPTTMEIEPADKAVEVLRMLPKTCLTWTMASMSQLHKLHRFVDFLKPSFKIRLFEESGEFALTDQGQIADLTEILSNIPLLLITVKKDLGLRELFSDYISLKSTLGSSDKLAKIAQVAFAIASCLNYQIVFDAEVLLKAIDQSDECLIYPVNLLTILGLSEEDVVQLDAPNAIMSILLKSLGMYSKDPNKMRTNQLCDGIANVWCQRIEPFLKDNNFGREVCVDLLEAVISLSQVELDRNTFVTTYLNLLKTETLKNSAKVKLLDMLAFFLQPEITPITLELRSEHRTEIVEAVKLLLASNLPLDPQELARSSTKLSECGTLLRSVLSLLKTVSCPEAIQILTMTFCRYDEHFMDEDLDEALQCAMKRIWARPLVQERLLTSALEVFEQAVISAHPSSAFINLWHRYFRKFIQPLFLYVGPVALEHVGARNIVKWTQNLEIGVQRDELTVAHWMWRLLNCSATFYLLVVLYNRLPKTCLHGTSGGGVGSILKVFLGPMILDPLQKVQIKGKELTAMLIGKAYAILKDALEPPPNASLTHDLEATASILRRALWSASLACLVATLSATQTQEKTYNYVLACDPLSRFLPTDKNLNFPRQRSGKYRSAFIELREEFWLPSQREPYLRLQANESIEKRGAFGGVPNRGDLLQGSSFSVEINRFIRTSGTQIIRGSNFLAEFKKPISPSKGSISPSSSTASADFTQDEDVEAVQVNLEVDCLNTTSVMVCFVGLLKHMHRLGFLKSENSNDMPAILRFLYEHFNLSRSNNNVRAFVVKVIINCTEVFKPFAKLWLPVLINYASSGVEALVDSCGLSSLGIDLCLLLGEWGVSSDALPSTEVEKSAARSLLACLLKRTWISSTTEAGEDHTSSIPEGVASALKNNLELFRLLAESWLPTGVAIPYKELLFELQGHEDYKRTTFRFHLFKIILSSCNSFSPETDNLPLSQFINVLLKYVHQSQKTLLTVVWECAGLLASKFTSLCSNSQDGSENFLKSRGWHILPLSHLPTDLHPLVTELWSSVNDLNIAQRRKRPSEGPITSTIEAACAAASHWPVLAVHLTNTLLGMGIPESIEPATFSHCLLMFGKLMEDFKGSKHAFHLEQTAKIEIFQNMVNSNVMELIKWGTEIVLFNGTMLILRMIQFALVASQGDKDFSAEMPQHLILRLLQTLLSTLTRPNSTPNSRRVAYRAFVEARQGASEAGDTEIEKVCNLGLSYGLCAEDNQQLRHQLRKHISQHCLDSPLLGGSPSLSRCLTVLQLLSSSRHADTVDQALIGGIGQHLVSTILEVVLEPAINFTRTSISTSRFMLDPVVLSGTQQLLRSQTQAVDAGYATLALPEGSATEIQLMETQEMPSTSAFAQVSPMVTDSRPSGKSLFVSSNSTQIRQRNKLPSFKNLSRVEHLRRKFAFPATVVAQSPDIHAGSSLQEFFKQRTIQRQHAETTSTSDTSLSDSARLCRRHRLSFLPDVETLTLEALLKPLFQLANADPLGCGSVLLGLIFEAVIASTVTSPSSDIFVKGLGGALAGLLLRGQNVCLQLLWDLSGLEGRVLNLLPEPTLLAASAISAGQTAIGTLVLEEAFCAAAMRRSKYIRQSMSTPSPWTATTRRFFTSSLPVFILPQEEFEIASMECSNKQLATTTTTAATCWWQLTRLYADLGRSDELLGWLCDRWITGSKSTVLLERLGTAIVAKVFGDYESAFMQLSDLLTSSSDADDDDDKDKINEGEGEGTESSIWSTCPAGLNAEIRLVCREELLQCLARLGSWKDLDVAATSTATSLITMTDDPSSTATEARPSTSNATVVDEFASLWTDPYPMESVIPQIIHSRLHQCLSAEINKVIFSHSALDTDALYRFCRIMESGLRSTSQDFETRFAYELAIFSVLCEDLSRAQLRCKSAFKSLRQTWSSEECRNTRLQKTQLLIELKEFLEASAEGLDAHSASKLFHTWQERCSVVSEDLTTSRLFFLSKMTAAGCLPLNEQLLPAVVNFRLECSNAFSRSGNPHRAINQLTPLYKLVQMLGQAGDDSEYRHLAWCSTFSRAWISAYSQGIVFCASATGRDNNPSADLENGLLRCLSLNSHCIEIYEALRQLPSMGNEDAALAQFSHAISTARILSAFHDFQKSGRLSDLGLRRYTTSLQPTLKTRFSQICGLSEVKEVDFLESSAFVFFKRCVDSAMGVWSAVRGSSPSAEKAIYRRNLLAHSPDEALLEVANFCSTRISEGGRNRDVYADIFTRSVLTAMRMGAKGGRIRFGRVLQVEVARCKSAPQHDPGVFCELTKHLPPWMFSQWFDRLLNAPLEGAACLVADILRRIAQRYSQALALPFRVLVTSACGWKHDGQSLVEQFAVKLTEDGKGDAISVFTELSSMLSKHVRLNRLLAELEYFDDPDIVFKDWASSYARKSIRSDCSNRADLVTSCNSLLEHGFLRLHSAEISSTPINANTGRQCAVQILCDLVQQEFGHDCKALQNITLHNFDCAIQRIISAYKPTTPKTSRMDQFSQWLVNFSPDEQDPIEMLGQCLDSSSERQAVVTVERVDLNVKCLASLRRPKLVRLLGNDGHWRGWLVKGGEDLRQDTSIQRLLGFANYAIASATATTSTSASAEPLRTYAVVPVSSTRGLIRWLDSTTTLLAFAMNAMTVRETERYLAESDALAAKFASHAGDFFWGSEATAASMVSQFTELEDFVFSLRLLRRGLRNSVATSAEHFDALRHRLITSHATICAVHFILGVGDRHMGNLLLDTSTGSLVGIDFGFAFGVTLSFPTPEYVPIRLTASLRELLEPSGPAGLFGATLCRTLAALRHHSSLFLSTIQSSLIMTINSSSYTKTFIEDNSTTEWSVYSEHYGQSEEEYRRCRLSLLRRKLIGHCPAELLIDDLRGRFGTCDWFAHFEVIARTTVASAGDPVVLPPPEQVRRLVCLSTCPELLARMHSGWGAAL